MSKKIQVSFSDKQVELLERLKGEFGETDADVVRNIVVAWLAEKSFISTVIKQRIIYEMSERKER
uniref:CopG family transcriptional regulator n=1 Tax=Nitratidesulfovibrio vulgaris (strain DSM 19637 / Miyazaki F) TaxID=883 RepID=B8DPA0_NITV9